MSEQGPNYQDAQGENTEAPIEGARMTFFEHLGELANRLKKCLYAFIIAFALVSALPDPTRPFGGPHSLFGYNFLAYLASVSSTERLAPRSSDNRYRSDGPDLNFHQRLIGRVRNRSASLHVLRALRLCRAGTLLSRKESRQEISATFHGIIRHGRTVRSIRNLSNHNENPHYFLAGIRRSALCPDK